MKHRQSGFGCILGCLLTVASLIAILVGLVAAIALSPYIIAFCLLGFVAFAILVTIGSGLFAR